MIQLTCDLDDEVRWSPIREFMQFLLTLNLNVKKRKFKNAPETKIETFLNLKSGHRLNTFMYSDEDLQKSSIKSHVYWNTLYLSILHLSIPNDNITNVKLQYWNVLNEFFL